MAFWEEKLIQDQNALFQDNSSSVAGIDLHGEEYREVMNERKISCFHPFLARCNAGVGGCLPALLRSSICRRRSIVDDSNVIDIWSSGCIDAFRN